MPATVMQRLFRNVRPSRIRPKFSTVAPVGGSITLTFASSATDADGGVSGVVGATDAEQAFSFTEVTPRTGLPIDLEISESGTLRLVVTFPSDYVGQAYTYTDRAGVPHAGTFPSSNGTVNY